MALDGTYSGLKASIASWLDREDLSTPIADFVTMATNRLSRDLRVAEMETVASSEFVEGEVSLPDDFLELRQVIGGVFPQRALRLAPPGYVADRFSGFTAGNSTYYTITGNTLTTFPSAGDGDISILYYAKIPALSDANPTNWLLTKAPELYLYASLIESAPFLGDDNRVGVWGTLYNQAKDALQSQDTRSRYAGAVSRVRGPTP